MGFRIEQLETRVRAHLSLFLAQAGGSLTIQKYTESTPTGPQARYQQRVQTYTDVECRGRYYPSWTEELTGLFGADIEAEAGACFFRDDILTVFPELANDEHCLDKAITVADRLVCQGVPWAIKKTHVSARMRQETPLFLWCALVPVGGRVRERL